MRHAFKHLKYIQKHTLSFSLSLSRTYTNMWHDLTYLKIYTQIFYREDTPITKSSYPHAHTHTRTRTRTHTHTHTHTYTHTRTLTQTQQWLNPYTHLPGGEGAPATNSPATVTAAPPPRLCFSQTASTYRHTGKLSKVSPVVTRVLQCVAVCCRVLQCIVVCCSVLQKSALLLLGCCNVLRCVVVCCSVLQRVAVCCYVLQYVAKVSSVVTSMLQCVAACCSMLQCVSVCFSVLQCVSKVSSIVTICSEFGIVSFWEGDTHTHPYLF